MNSLSPLVERYVARQLAADRAGALRVIMDEGIGGGMSVSEIQLEVLRPAQYEIGRLWQENVITVAQEHVATAITQLVLSHLYGHLPPHANIGQRVIVACVEGERHEIGARMIADQLEGEGCEVHFLGADVPTGSLVEHVTRALPCGVALSASMAWHADALREATRRSLAAGASWVVAGGRIAGSAAELPDWPAEAIVCDGCTDVMALVAAHGARSRP